MFDFEILQNGANLLGDNPIVWNLVAEYDGTAMGYAGNTNGFSDAKATTDIQYGNPNSPPWVDYWSTNAKPAFYIELASSLDGSALTAT